MNEYGVQEVIVRDNKFTNVSYNTPGLISVSKANMLNMDVQYQNNYFENIFDITNPYSVTYI